MAKEVRRRKAPIESFEASPRNRTRALMTHHDNSIGNKSQFPLKQNTAVGKLLGARFTAVWNQLWLPLKRSRRIKLLIAVAICAWLRHLQIRYFGQSGSLQGGLVGRFVDNLLRTLHFRDALRRRNLRLAEFGNRKLPPMTEPHVNQRGLPVLTQSYLSETLIRSTIRRRAQDAVEQRVSVGNRSHVKGFSPWILQPIVGEWFHPWRDTGGLEILQFDESEMHRLLRHQCPGFLPFFDDMTQPLQDRIILWSICALFYYGGYFFASNINNVTLLRQQLAIPTLWDTLSHVTVAVLSRNVQTSAGDEIRIVAATPRHPRLRYAIKTLESRINVTLSESGRGRLQNMAVVTSDLLGVETIADLNTWYFRPCQTLSASDIPCTKAGELQTVSATEKLKTDPTIVLKLVERERPVQTDDGGPRVLVDVTEESVAPQPRLESKQPIQRLLNDSRCVLGWLCNRCWKTSWYGSFQSCSKVCNSCYENILCERPDDPPKKDVVIDVHVREKRPLAPGEKLIPRIIHQTWYDEISPDRYPHFVRLQNSWKSSGWEYRFYTDDDVRNYISQYFPSRFLAAFDALIPGAFKADVFRLVVLLKDGGVYVDVDVKLDANLDSFITPTMSFFVPRDLVAEPGEYCLWNGIIGAAPGHPLIAAALERMLGTVLNRADYHDVERDLCQKSASGRSTEIWKARALPVVLLTGPCALGISVNAALGRDSLVSKIEVGWLLPNRTSAVSADRFGDMLILLADKYDMGEMRFTDVDRNLLFASTNQNLMPSKAIDFLDGPPPPVPKVKPKAHYSSTVRESGDVFGSRGVYIDNQVTNENIQLRLSYTT